MQNQQFSQSCVVNTELQQYCQVIINNDFREELEAAIKARDRWGYLNKTLDVASHLLTGSTTILAFISASMNLQSLSIAAGCCGAGATVCMSYSQYCKTQYKNNTNAIKDMSEKIKLNDILVDCSDYMNNDKRARIQQRLAILEQESSLVGQQLQSLNQPKIADLRSQPVLFSNISSVPPSDPNCQHLITNDIQTEPMLRELTTPLSSPNPTTSSTPSCYY